MSSLLMICLYLTIIFLYSTGAILSLLSKDPQKIRYFAYVFAAISSLTGVALALIKLTIYSYNDIYFSINSSIEYLSINFHIDNLSAIFILIISFLVLAVSIYSVGYTKHYDNKSDTNVFGALFNFFCATMILVVTADHLMLFLVFWELMSLSSYLLVIYEGEKEDVQKAGLIYLIMTHIGTAFITIGFLLIITFSGTGIISEIDFALIPNNIRNIVFLLLLVGFGTKAGIIPLHVWLPRAHPAAPSNVSALMSGVMIKTAIFGIIRFIYIDLSTEFVWWGVIILALGAFSAVLGVIYALMEHNIKKLLAYSSIENIGIINIGLGLSIIAAASGKPSIAAISLTAALFHSINHSLFKGVLFLGAGAIDYSTHTKNIEELGGLIKKMPYTAIFFLIGSLSISAIPPFNGFISEWISYQAMLNSINASGSFIRLVTIISAALLALAGALAVYCFVKVFGIAFLGILRSDKAKNAVEVGRPMLFGMGLLSLACALTGLFPMTIIRLLDKVNLQIAGTTIAKNFKGFSFLVFYPFTIENSSISLIELAVLFLFIITVAFIALKIVSNKTKIKLYDTWDCGFGKINSKMQYTATGFSKPIRIVFRALIQPQRELETEEAIMPYFITSAIYKVKTEPVFEKYFYIPFIKKIFSAARRTSYAIQTGSIHTYLFYIFAAIVSMLLYFVLSF